MRGYALVIQRINWLSAIELSVRVVYRKSIELTGAADRIHVPSARLLETAFVHRPISAGVNSGTKVVL